MTADCELDKVCTLLDKLTIDSLTTLEDVIQTKLELENSMCEGESHLAKTRYIMGRNSISTLQLPTKNGNEFEALTVVHSEGDENAFGELSLDLEAKKLTEGEENLNPVRWFGVLVPQNLYSAQVKFKQALLWAVKAANLQTQLYGLSLKINALKGLKESLI